MFDYAFSQYETKPFYSKNEKIGEFPIKKGERRKLKAVAGESVSLLVKKGEKVDNVKKQLVINKDLKAPIKKGTEIGKIVISKDGKVLAENSIIAAEDMNSASWWTLFKRSFGMFTKIQ